MNRSTPTTQPGGRHADKADLALDRGATLMQHRFDAGAKSRDVSPAPGAERADRLVRPEVACHYLRQGERIADAVMAIHAFARRLIAGGKGAARRDDVHAPFTGARR